MFCLVAALLTGLGVWGWWAAPRLTARCRDEQERASQVNMLRRGVLAYFLGAAVLLWLTVNALVR